ncbi:MAG: N-6 DNA methylase [Streptococcus sp.]|nr:N-6 DNA methylase [Streptococcus sp.]
MINDIIIKMEKFQVFTPEKYVNIMLDKIEYNGPQILKKYFLENSVGEGNILFVAIKRYIEVAITQNISATSIKYDLEKYFVAFEIDSKLILNCLNKLDNLILNYGIEKINWQIIHGDYLKHHFNHKFDFVVGNPPYITYQELTNENRQFLKDNFVSCEKGKFDYCYAFLEKSLFDLKKSTGRMSYLIPSSIFKNVFAENLRNILKKNICQIIDYRHTRVFGKILTSSAIVVFDNSIISNNIEYVDSDFNKKYFIKKINLGFKWYFTENIDLQKGKIFGDFFKVSNSVATLSNKVFVISEEIELEHEVIRPAASPRKSSKNITEKIIFPYKYKNNEFIRYSKKEFEINFPKVTSYLKEQKEILDNRKSDGEWFEYGRSQGLRFMNQEKLMISSVITEKVNVYKLDAQTIPYSGFYIIPIAEETLDFAKVVLESEKFYNYLETRGISASGKSIRISVNDIKNYPIEVGEERYG